MTAHRPSKPRFFLVLTLLLALVSCTPAAPPTSEAMLTAMRAVPGTRDAIVHAFSTGYAFSVTLEDNPSAETLQHVLEAYANGMPALNGQVSCVVMWRSTKVRHRLSISSSRDHFVPDPASLTQLVEWPADLAVDADVQRSGFSVDVHSTDATFTKDLSRFLKARPVVDRMRVLSPPRSRLAAGRHHRSGLARDRQPGRLPQGHARRHRYLGVAAHFNTAGVECRRDHRGRPRQQCLP